jgi:hypothetical protein
MGKVHELEVSAWGGRLVDGRVGLTRKFSSNHESAFMWR